MVDKEFSGLNNLFSSFIKYIVSFSSQIWFPDVITSAPALKKFLVIFFVIPTPLSPAFSPFTITKSIFFFDNFGEVSP